MKEYGNVETGCRYLGEYVYQAEVPPDLNASRGEPMRPTRLMEYIVEADNAAKEFTVLLQDGRAVSVRGHGVKQVPPSTAGEQGSYGVFQRTDGEDVFVGLFKIPEVVGVFHGEVRPDRQIAL